MKIKVKQRDWSSFKVARENITEHEYEDELLVKDMKHFVDYEDYDDRYQKKNIFGKVIETGWQITRRTYFAFKVLEKNDDCIKLEIEGIAGGIWNEKKRESLPQIITLKKGEERKFSTDSLDSGKEFFMSYVD